MAAPLPVLPKYIQNTEELRAWILQWLSNACDDERKIVIRGWYELWAARTSARETNRIENPSNNLAEEWKSIQQGVTNHWVSTPVSTKGSQKTTGLKSMRNTKVREEGVLFFGATMAHSWPDHAIFSLHSRCRGGRAIGASEGSNLGSRATSAKCDP